MNERSSSLRFTFCTVCSALILVSGTESHVCQPRVPDSVAACAIEVPMPLHIREGGNPGRPQISFERIVLTTSTSSR